MRLEVKQDIAAIREAVQTIDRAVAQIKGYLGINGGQPHPHHRDAEPVEFVHKRASDTFGGRLRDNWQILLIAVLAALAGERALTEVAKIVKAALTGTP